MKIILWSAACISLLVSVMADDIKTPSGVTFYAGFEGTADASVSAGKSSGNAGEKTVHFQEGFRGQALLAGDGEPFVEYDAQGNITTPEGSIEMLVKPVNWAKPCWGFHIFFRASGGDTVDAQGNATGGTGVMQVYKYGHFVGDFNFFLSDSLQSYTAVGGDTRAEWYHFVATWSKNDIRFFENGKRTPPTSLTEPFKSAMQRFWLGDDPWSGAAKGAKEPEWKATAENRNAKTLIDEVYFYNRALSDEEVAWAFENKNKREPGQDIPLLPSMAVQELTVAPRPMEKCIAMNVSANPRLKGMDFTGEWSLQGPENITGVGAITWQEDGTSKVLIPCPSFPAGRFTVSVKLKTKDGKLLGEKSVSLDSPGPAVWIGTKVGISPLPPKPYTPVKEKKAAFSLGNRKITLDRYGFIESLIAYGQGLLAKCGFICRKQEAGFSCWNREITFDQSGFIKSVFSGGQELLARPMELAAITGGKPVVWENKSFKKISGDANRIVGESEAVSGIGTLSMRITAEYDGMIRYDMQLKPPVPAEVDCFELKLPVRKDMATLSCFSGSLQGGVFATFQEFLEAEAKRNGETAARPETAETKKEIPWNYYFWLGNEDAGIAGIVESDEAWDKAGRKDAIRIERRNDAVELVWSFAKSSWCLPELWTLTIGIQPTPVKSAPPSLRKWRLGDNVKQPEIPNPNFMIYWTGPHVNPAFGYPQANDPAKYREFIRARTEKGIGIVPYVLANHLAINTPEYEFYFRRYRDPDSRIAAQSDVAAFGPASGVVAITPVPEFIDFITWKSLQYMRAMNFRGLYHDLSTPRPSSLAETGCGYVRDGKRVPTITVFATRDLFRRMYTMQKNLEKETGQERIMINHMEPLSWLGAYCDLVWWGEGHKKDYRTTLTPLEMRLSMGHNLGFRTLWLPQDSAAGARASLEKKNAKGGALLEYPEAQTRYLVALLWLHDMSLTPSLCNTQVAREMFLAMDNFGDFPEADFLPYWKNQKIIGGQEPEKLLCSAYVKPRPDGGALLCVGNATDQPKKAALTLDFKALHAGGRPRVSDMNGDKELPIKDGQIELDVPPYDFRLLRVK